MATPINEREREEEGKRESECKCVLGIGNWQTAIEAESIARIVIGSTWSTTNSSGSRDKVRSANVGYACAREREREIERLKERSNGNSHLVEQFKLR